MVHNIARASQKLMLTMFGVVNPAKKQVVGLVPDTPVILELLPFQITQVRNLFLIVLKPGPEQVLRLERVD